MGTNLVLGMSVEAVLIVRINAVFSLIMWSLKIRVAFFEVCGVRGPMWGEQVLDDSMIVRLPDIKGVIGEMVRQDRKVF